MANGPDWADIFDATGTVIPGRLALFGGVAASFEADANAAKGGTDPTTFSGAGGSNKNNDPLGPQDCVAQGLPANCDSWHWDGGNVPAKDDLTNVYAYATFNEDEELIIYAGFERIAPEGDSHVDLEFFQDPVALYEDPPCNDPGNDPVPCDFTGVRTIGDLIVSMDFVQGGGIGEVSIRAWDGTEYVQIGESTGQGCNEPDGTDPGDTICAFNNNVTIDGGPWDNFERGGAVITELPANAFTEFGVNVTALLGGGTPCISTFMGKTRSSQSFTAELKDFSGPEAFNICGASIAIAPDDVNEVGQDHTFTVTVLQELGQTTEPAAGEIVEVTLTDANGAINAISANTCANPGTNAAGQCSVTFTSSAAGTVTGHASADVDVFGTEFHVETDGTGENSGDAVKRFVDAFITITPSEVNEVGAEHIFTVNVQQDDGSGVGFVDVPDGTIVTVTLTPVGVADGVVDTCATGTLGGECTVTFTSDVATVITGHASVSLTIAGLTVVRQTDGTGDNSGDAVKRFVDAFITITPSEVNEVGAEHIFTVNVQQDDGSGVGFVDVPDGTIVTVTLTPVGVADGVVDTCATGTLGGECTVTFTSDVATVITGHASVSLTIAGLTVVRQTDGTGDNSGDAVKRFVDAFITITPSEVNEVGAEHIFTVNVQQDDGSGVGFVDVPDGTIVTVTLTPVGVADGVVDTCATGTLGGECTVTFTSDVATVITGHASVSLTIAGLTVVRQTDGTGDNSGDAVKRFVDAFITIGPDDVNSVGETHTFTVNVQQDTGSGGGFVDPPDGTIVDVDLTGDADGVVDTCAAPGTVGGQCTVTFTSDTAGTVTAHASVTLNIAGLTVTRQTDGIGDNSGDATKEFVAGTIRWEKRDNAGALQGGATFEVCRTHNLNTETGLLEDIDPDVCVTVVDDVDGVAGPGLDQDPDPGQFLLTGLRLGRYTVDETVAPPGFEPDPAVRPAVITLLSPDAEIAIDFVNQRPILKLTEFGYTNEPTGTPTAGVVSGVSVFTAVLENFGGASAALYGQPGPHRPVPRLRVDDPDQRRQLHPWRDDHGHRHLHLHKRGRRHGGHRCTRRRLHPQRSDPRGIRQPGTDHLHDPSRLTRTGGRGCHAAPPTPTVATIRPGADHEASIHTTC